MENWTEPREVLLRSLATGAQQDPEHGRGGDHLTLRALLLHYGGVAGRGHPLQRVTSDVTSPGTLL